MVRAKSLHARLWFHLRTLGSMVLVDKPCGYNSRSVRKFRRRSFSHRHKRRVKSILEGLAARRWGDGEERKHRSWIQTDHSSSWRWSSSRFPSLVQYKKTRKTLSASLAIQYLFPVFPFSMRFLYAIILNLFFICAQ